MTAKTSFWCDRQISYSLRLRVAFPLPQEITNEQLRTSRFLYELFRSSSSAVVRQVGDAMQDLCPYSGIGDSILSSGVGWFVCERDACLDVKVEKDSEEEGEEVYELVRALQAAVTEMLANEPQ